MSYTVSANEVVQYLQHTIILSVVFSFRNLDFWGMDIYIYYWWLYSLFSVSVPLAL